MPLPNGIFGAIKARIDSDPTTAGLELTQGTGKARAAAIYCVARLKSWTPAFESSDSTWYDCRVELRVHAASPELSGAAATLVQLSLSGRTLEWSVGSAGPPLSVTRRREQFKGLAVGGDHQAVDVVELWYRADGLMDIGAAAGDADDPTSPAGFDSAGFDSMPFDA